MFDSMWTNCPLRDVRFTNCCLFGTSIDKAYIYMYHAFLLTKKQLLNLASVDQLLAGIKRAATVLPLVNLAFRSNVIVAQVVAHINAGIVRAVMNSSARVWQRLHFHLQGGASKHSHNMASRQQCCDDEAHCLQHHARCLQPSGFFPLLKYRLLEPQTDCCCREYIGLLI